MGQTQPTPILLPQLLCLVRLDFSPQDRARRVRGSTNQSVAKINNKTAVSNKLINQLFKISRAIK